MGLWLPEALGVSDAYGQLFELNAGGSPIVIAVPGTFVKWTTSSVALAGPSDLIVPSAASDDLTVGAAGGGVYKVGMHATFDNSVNNITVDGAIFRNGVDLGGGLGFRIRLGSGANTFAQAAVSGLLTLVAGDVLDVRFTASGASTIEIFQLILHAFSVVRTI